VVTVGRIQSLHSTATALWVAEDTGCGDAPPKDVGAQALSTAMLGCTRDGAAT